jgi:hypothetical protein
MPVRNIDLNETKTEDLATKRTIRSTWKQIMSFRRQAIHLVAATPATAAAAISIAPIIKTVGQVAHRVVTS